MIGALTHILADKLHSISGYTGGTSCTSICIRTTLAKKRNEAKSQGWLKGKTALSACVCVCVKNDERERKDEDKIETMAPGSESKWAERCPKSRII